jgi:hypothetical protein
MLPAGVASRAAHASVAGGRTCVRDDELEPRVSLAAWYQDGVADGSHWEGEEGGKSKKYEPSVFCPGCVARTLGVTEEVE